MVLLFVIKDRQSNIYMWNLSWILHPSLKNCSLLQRLHCVKIFQKFADLIEMHCCHFYFYFLRGGALYSKSSSQTKTDRQKQLFNVLLIVLRSDINVFPLQNLQTIRIMEKGDDILQASINKLKLTLENTPLKMESKRQCIISYWSLIHQYLSLQYETGKRNIVHS